MKAETVETFRFDTDVAALAGAVAARRRLERRVRALAEAGKAPVDQAFPEEALGLEPPSASKRPLLLLGGMGPLAGLEGFERAVKLFGNERRIMLLQACATPDRTEAARAGEGSPAWRAVAAALEGALSLAATRLPETEVDWIVLCNSAHAFLPEAWARFTQRRPALAARWRMISLVDAAAAQAEMAGHAQALLAATDGARQSGVYSRAFAQRGLTLIEPDADLQARLMRAIYNGVKSMDDEETLAAGSAFFEGARARYPQTSCLIAGCTEVPPILETIRDRGAAALRDWLADVDVVDPTAAALAACRDGGPKGKRLSGLA